MAAGRANLWVLEGRRPDGLVLEIAEREKPVVLCIDCLAVVPDEPSAADIERLRAERGGDG